MNNRKPQLAISPNPTVFIGIVLAFIVSIRANAAWTSPPGEFIINVAGKEVFSLRELSEIIGEKLNISPKFEIKKSLQNDLIADISLMTDKLYTPKISFKSGLKDLTSV